MFKRFIFLIISILVYHFANAEKNRYIIRAVDLSSLPQINEFGEIFYDFDGNAKKISETLSKNGINTIRIRVWNNPKNNQSSPREVKSLAERMRLSGFAIWLALHYSDTWADPGHQRKPQNWQNIPFQALKDSVYAFTGKIVKEIKPQYIQIGNEINSGMLFPDGKISNSENNFTELLLTGIKAVRENSKDTKIIVHFAGIDGAFQFFEMIKKLDYDMIGLSYYPFWHGKDLAKLSTIITDLGDTFSKNIIIAETAYPFTLDWADQTVNIVGKEEQLILPEFPATPDGQYNFITTLLELVTKTEAGIGICYWGGELTAYKGYNSTNGSSWENMALYDFNGRALPVIKALGSK